MWSSKVLDHKHSMHPRSASGRRVSFALVGVGFVVASIGSSCNLDPVHRANVSRLGEEQSELYPPESEYHRPGEPCALCHSKQGPAESEFILGGTVFWGPDRYDRRVDQAYVRIAGPERAKRCFVTNCNGNFFVRPEDFKSLKFPLLVSVERVRVPGGNGPDDNKPIAYRAMSGQIGREPSCAACHIAGLRDYASVGQIHLFETEAAVDAANPPIPPSCPNDLPRVTRCPEEER